MDEHKGDHERGGPTVNRTDDPAQRDLGHYPCHALVGPFKRWSVVKSKHKSSDHLNGEKKQDGASRVVPYGMPVLGNLLISQKAEYG
jgi:hypothetical protein